METVGVSVTRLKESFDVNFYPDWQLSRGVFFDKKNFGVTKIVSGDPGRAVSDDIPPDRLNGRKIEDFINDFPLSENDRKALIDLHVRPGDYLPGMTVDEKMEWLDTHSYSEFLATKVGLSKMALPGRAPYPAWKGWGYRRWTESRWPTSKSRMFTISRTVTPVWPDC